MNNLLAALMFFTRLPFHKIKQVPSECFSHVTGWWSVTGWLTGGVSALTFCIFHLFEPFMRTDLPISSMDSAVVQTATAPCI